MIVLARNTSELSGLRRVSFLFFIGTLDKEVLRIANKVLGKNGILIASPDEEEVLYWKNYVEQSISAGS